MLAACALLGACGARPEPTTEDPPSLEPVRGMILLSIDTLRADSLGLYGYRLDTSPFIDSLAERALVFDHAFVQLPGTLPSHMSMLTGLYPQQHGVLPPAGVLGPDLPYLPQILQEAGLVTAGHTEGGYVDGKFGFPRGFTEWSHEAKKIETDVERTFARGVDFLRSLGPDDRFFLFLHTYVVHDPYFPSPEYLELFWDGPKPDVPPPTGPNLVAMSTGALEMPEGALEFYRASYDASVRYADDQVQALFASLEELGLLDETAIIITSDHGEEFLEHGRLTHDQVYPEVMQVPMIVLHPSLRPGRTRTVVQSIDLTPTFLDIAGVAPEQWPQELPGRSLTRFFAGAEEPSSEAYGVNSGLRQRTLVQHEGDRLLQLVHYRNEKNATYVGTEAAIDILDQSLDFRVKAFHEPRRVEYFLDGALQEVLELAPDAWTQVRIPASSTESKRQILLQSDGCRIPAEVRESRDRRCLSIRIEDLSLQRFKLFDLDDDPQAFADLSSEENEAPVVRDLLRRLTREYYRLVPRADSEQGELDAELTQRLQSLGYL